MISVNFKEIKFEKFPNGETRIVRDSFPKIDGDIISVSFKFEDDSDLIKLMFVKNYLDQILFSKRFKIVLNVSYMPYSRMDRTENGSPFTLKYVANFMNSLEFDAVKIIEPHSDVTTALVDKSMAIMCNEEYLLEEVKADVEFKDEIDYIVFPDNGASKRYSNVKAKNVLVGHKHRDFETGEIKSLNIIGDVNGKGKKAIIVDDLSSYGGTFVATSKELKKLGIEEVYLLVAHAENSIFKGELFNHVDKVFTTNSILTEHSNWENQRFADKLKIYDVLGM